MAGFDTKVKFDSRDAEKGVDKLVSKIGGLTREMKTAKEAASVFGKNWASASTQMNSAATRANGLQSKLGALNRTTRSAAASVNSFFKSFNTASMGRAASVIQSLNTGMAKTAAQSKAAKAEAASLHPELRKVGTAGTAAANGILRLNGRLDTLVPKLKQARTGAAALAAALTALSGRYVFSASGAGTFASAAGRATSATNGLGTSVARTGGQINAYGNHVKSATKNLLDFGSAALRARNLAVYLVGGLGIQKVTEYLDTFRLVGARLNLVSDQFHSQIQLERDIFDVSQRTRTGYAENAKLFVKLAQAGKQYGVSMTTSLRVTENVNRALKISGATTGEATAATLQLGQAFASGRLQGDELRSLLENSPRLAIALSKSLGVTIGEVRKLGKAGEIGIEQMVKAFGNKEITAELEKEFAKIPPTISDTLKTVENSFIRYLGKVDETLGISNGLITVLSLVADNFDTIGIAAGITAGVIAIRYIPAMLGAARASAVFVAANLANYGVSTGAAFANMAFQARVIGRVLPTKQLGSFALTTAAVGRTAGATGIALRTLFLSTPPLIAAGTAALVLYKSEFKPIRDEAATTQDYLVTGFKSTFETIFGQMNDWGNFWDSFWENRTNAFARNFNRMYKLAKALPSGLDFKALGHDVLSITDSAVGGAPLPPLRYVSGINKAYSNADTIGTDFQQSSVLQGTQWQKKANRRAIMRLNGDADTFGTKNNMSFLNKFLPEGIRKYVAPDDVDNLHSPTGADDAGTKKLEALKRALDSLESSISPVEKQENNFTKGLQTLDRALDKHLINLSRYRSLIGLLAADSFPGLTDEIKDRQSSVIKLRMKNDGQSDAEIEDALKIGKVEESISAIDALIKKEGDRTGVLKTQRAELTKQVKTYKDLGKEETKLKDAAIDREEQLRQMVQLADNFVDRLSESFTTGITRMLSFNGNVFSNWFKEIAGLARGTFASLISASIVGPLQAKYRKSIERAVQGKSQTGLGRAIGDLFGPRKMAVPVTQAEGDDGEITVTAKPKLGFFGSAREGFTGQFKESAKALKDIFKPAGKLFEKVAGKFGFNTDKLGKTFGAAAGGAAIGSQIAGLGKALGLKTSKLGGQIGGAIGAASGIPGGQLIGSLIGSIGGGLFKKTASASSNITTSVSGRLNAGKATGSGSLFAAVNALGDGVVSRLQNASAGLQADLATNFKVGSIGQRKKKFTFDETGSGRTKGAGVQTFKTEEEAVEAAFKSAIRRGILTGLSATSDRILKTFADTDTALSLASDIETVKRQARQLGDPIKYSFDELAKQFDRLKKSFDEAGASTEDYADLQKVFADQQAKIVSDQSGVLKAFLEDLKTGDSSYKTSFDRLGAADAKFADLESQIASGKNVDQSTFTSAGQDLQGLARDVYGSTAKFYEYQQRLIDATNKLIGNVQTQADTYAPIVNAISAAADAQGKANALSAEYLRQIADALAGGGTYLGGSSGQNDYKVSEFQSASNF